MSVNSAVAQGHAQGSIGASGQFPTQSTATGNNYDFPAPCKCSLPSDIGKADLTDLIASMTKDFATFIPMPQGGHSGLTAKQASIIMKAFTKSVLDRNTAVLDGLRPDAEELKKHMDSIRVWEAALGSQPPEKIRLALADNAGEGDTKSVAECLQRDSFKVIERANKILRVLYLERTHSPARAKSMDNIESQVKEDMNEVQRILGRALSTLNMKYPPGAEFGLTPHRDVKLYEGAPLLFYPEHPENPDEDGELKGEWYVAEFDHPVVAAPGTPWNKWIKNWADSDSNMTTIKLPPIARALLSEIKGNYHKAFVQFIRVSHSHRSCRWPRGLILDTERTGSKRRGANEASSAQGGTSTENFAIQTNMLTFMNRSTTTVCSRNFSSSKDISPITLSPRT